MYIIYIYIYIYLHILLFLTSLYRTIEDITKSLNHVQMELDDYMLENEELRGRLGMDPKERLDAKVIRKKKHVKEEQALALNRVLAKEVSDCFADGLYTVVFYEGNFERN